MESALAQARKMRDKRNELPIRFTALLARFLGSAMAPSHYTILYVRMLLCPRYGWCGLYTSCWVKGMISIKPQRFAELINHSGRKPPPSVPPKILLISSQHAPSPPATPPKTQLVSSQHTSSPQVAPPKTRLVSSQHSSSPVRFLSSHNAVQWLLSAVESGQAIFKILPSWSNVLQPEHERVIAGKIGLGAPVFVTDYYLAMKPFYMLRSNINESREGPATVACFGLLLPDICEVAGGSLREHRVESLLHSMRKHGLQKSSILEELAPNHKSYVVPPNKAANLDSSSRQERTPSSLHAQR